MSDSTVHGYFPTITPYIVVRDARAAIQWYEKALGASTRYVMDAPDGKVMNAQLVIGNSVLMLNDEFPDYGAMGPQDGERVHTTLHLQTDDIERDFNRAIEAGATVGMPPADMFWGDRYGSFTDPFGYKWSMGQRIANPTPEEMEAAMKAAFADNG